MNPDYSAACLETPSPPCDVRPVPRATPRVCSRLLIVVGFARGRSRRDWFESYSQTALGFRGALR